MQEVIKATGAAQFHALSEAVGPLVDGAKQTIEEYARMDQEQVDEMEDAGMEMSASALHRKYLSKLTDDLRQTVLSKAWPLSAATTGLEKYLSLRANC